MTVDSTAGFKRGLRAFYRSIQVRDGTRAADQWADAAVAAIAALAATHPGFEASYALSRETDLLPGGPYRDKLFGVGRRKTHRLVFRLASEPADPSAANPAAVELVAVRHLAQDDLTPLDL